MNARLSRYYRSRERESDATPRELILSLIIIIVKSTLGNKRSQEAAGQIIREGTVL